MKTAVIISGGNIEEDFALRFLQEKKVDYVIAADRGLRFLKEHGIKPTHIVGDFDSLSAEEGQDTSGCAANSINQERGQSKKDSGNWNILEAYEDDPEVIIRKFRPEKDWTDTEIAAELALELGCTSMDILGATGTRLDHVMGNFQLLALILEKGGEGCLADPYNKIYMKDRPFQLKRREQWGKYVSLFAYGGDVTGLTLRGMKYPLNQFTLGSVGTRGVSNEIVDETADISFAGGKLLVMETRD